MKNFCRRLWFDGLLYCCNQIVSHIPSHIFRRVFYRSLMQFEIGRGTFIFMGARFDCRAGFFLGDHSVVNANCHLDNRGTLRIGNNVSISPDVCILTADHDPQSETFAGRTQPVEIEDYVFVGTRATILPGVKIGRGAVVAAASVVTKNVAPFEIVAGNPAQPIGQRTTELRYQLEYGRLFA